MKPLSVPVKRKVLCDKIVFSQRINANTTILFQRTNVILFKSFILHISAVCLYFQQWPFSLEPNYNQKYFFFAFFCSLSNIFFFFQFSLALCLFIPILPFFSLYFAFFHLFSFLFSSVFSFLFICFSSIFFMSFSS